MKRINKNETGLVSLIVTMILMVIIALIVIGFARTARYEQRQSLDRQLSAQAFYAAETGINDAILALNSNYPGYDVPPSGNDGGTGNKTHCGPDPAGDLRPGSNIVDTNTKAEYTCLLINQNPTSLVYNPVGEGQAISADLTFRDSGGAVGTAARIEIQWKPADGSDPTIPSVPFQSFPPIAGPGSWDSNTAVARVALTNFNDIINNYSRDILNNSTMTAFLYPAGGPGNVNFSSAPTGPTGQGQIVGGTCPGGAGSTCTMSINTVNSRHVYLRIGSIYKDSQITITAYPAFGPPLLIVGGQAVIDSTGKAQDVLRRIQVRLPINTKGGPMNYAVQSVEGICKNFSIGPGLGSDIGNCITPP